MINEINDMGYPVFRLARTGCPYRVVPPCAAPRIKILRIFNAQRP